MGNAQVVTVGLLHLQMCFNTDWQCDTHTHTKTHACAHTGAPCPPVAFPDSWSQPSSPSLHSSPLPITCVLFSSLLISSIFYPSQVFLLFFPPPPPPNLKTRGTFYFFFHPQKRIQKVKESVLQGASVTESGKKPAGFNSMIVFTTSKWIGQTVVGNECCQMHWINDNCLHILSVSWFDPPSVGCRRDHMLNMY